MSEIMSRQLLSRHARPFAIALASLTLLLMANQTVAWLPRLSARGASSGTLAEVFFTMSTEGSTMNGIMAALGRSI